MTINRHLKCPNRDSPVAKLPVCCTIVWLTIQRCEQSRRIKKHCLLGRGKSAHKTFPLIHNVYFVFVKLRLTRLSSHRPDVPISVCVVLSVERLIGSPVSSTIQDPPSFSVAAEHIKERRNISDSSWRQKEPTATYQRGTSFNYSLTVCNCEIESHIKEERWEREAMFRRCSAAQLQIEMNISFFSFLIIQPYVKVEHGLDVMDS